MKHWISKRSILALLSASTLLLAGCHAQQKSKPKAIDEQLVDLQLDEAGSYTSTIRDYSLEGSLDPKVYTGLKTDVRGRLYMPSGEGPFPVLVFLHGNHGTCGLVNAETQVRNNASSAFTSSGSCPEGWVEAPSFAGYDYLAQKLVTHGYAIISINANLGITAGPGVLIKERGRLVLKHLATLSRWNKEGAGEALGGLDVKSKFDLNHVGFMGHSRGGEGVRAAYAMYKDQDPNTYAAEIGPMNVEAVFELAPVDRFEDTVYNVEGANWTVVIGTCDGDVSDYQGVDTYRRRRALNGLNTFSSVLAIPGANHNNFNTEWQIPETQCDRGEAELQAPQQQRVSLLLHLAFFRGFVGANKVQTMQNVFDPQYRLPRQISEITQLARETLEASSAKIAMVSGAATQNAEMVELDLDTRQLQKFTWEKADSIATLDLNLAKADISERPILSLSLSGKNDRTCKANESCGHLDFRLSLVYEDGSESKSVDLRQFAAIKRLPGGTEIPASCTGFAAKLGWCEAPNKANANACQSSPNTPRTFYQGKCYERLFSPTDMERNLLFDEAPIEWKDFGYDGQQGVKQIKLHFDKIPAGSFYLDKKLILRAKD